MKSQTMKRKKSARAKASAVYRIEVISNTRALLWF